MQKENYDHDIKKYRYYDIKYTAVIRIDASDIHIIIAYFYAYKWNIILDIIHTGRSYRTSDKIFF